MLALYTLYWFSCLSCLFLHHHNNIHQTYRTNRNPFTPLLSTYSQATIWGASDEEATIALNIYHDEIKKIHFKWFPCGVPDQIRNWDDNFHIEKDAPDAYKYEWNSCVESETALVVNKADCIIEPWLNTRFIQVISNLVHASRGGLVAIDWVKRDFVRG